MNRALFAFLLVLSTIGLAILKMISFPDLSWWWITAPLWVPLALALLLTVCIFFYALITLSNGNRKTNQPHQIG